MNNMRISNYVDEIFRGVKATDRVLEQKEELIINLTERVKDYMSRSLTFDDAFEAAKNDIGDVSELIAEFEKEEPEYDRHEKRTINFSGKNRWQLAALSPFIFLLAGFAFDWWAWAWVVIPICGIFSSPISTRNKVVACSPFVYVLLGFFFGWWAWGWIIIPVSAILYAKN